MAPVENFESVYQLAAEIGAAPAVVGQGGQGVNDRKASGEAAEVALDSPKGDQKAGLHAELGADLGEEGAVFPQQAASLLDPGGGNHPVHVLAECQGELGLLAVQFDHPWQGLQDAERRLESRGPNALGLGFAVQFLNPLLEGKRSARRRLNKGKEYSDDAGEMPPETHARNHHKGSLDCRDPPPFLPQGRRADNRQPPGPGNRLSDFPVSQ